MTKETILALAREADWPNWDGNVPTDDHEFRDFTEPLERFAALVAAASASVEREACAKVCEDYTDNDSGKFIDHEGHGYECAAVIRARGQA
jgi:hypothetical protein